MEETFIRIPTFALWLRLAIWTLSWMAISGLIFGWLGWRLGRRRIYYTPGPRVYREWPVESDPSSDAPTGATDVR